MAERVNVLLHTISSDQWAFKDPNLQKKAEDLELCNTSEDIVMGDADAERPRKRSRLNLVDPSKAEVDVSVMVSHLYQLLGNQEATDLAGLSLIARYFSSILIS